MHQRFPRKHLGKEGFFSRSKSKKKPSKSAPKSASKSALKSALKSAPTTSKDDEIGVARAEKVPKKASKKGWSFSRSNSHTKSPKIAPKIAHTTVPTTSKDDEIEAATSSAEKAPKKASKKGWSFSRSKSHKKSPKAAPTAVPITPEEVEGHSNNKGWKNPFSKQKKSRVEDVSPIVPASSIEPNVKLQPTLKADKKVSSYVHGHVVPTKSGDLTYISDGFRWDSPFILGGKAKDNCKDLSSKINMPMVNVLDHASARIVDKINESEASSSFNEGMFSQYLSDALSEYSRELRSFIGDNVVQHDDDFVEYKEVLEAIDELEKSINDALSSMKKRAGRRILPNGSSKRARLLYDAFHAHFVDHYVQIGGKFQDNHDGKYTITVGGFRYSFASQAPASHLSFVEQKESSGIHSSPSSGPVSTNIKDDGSRVHHLHDNLVPLLFNGNVFVTEDFQWNSPLLLLATEKIHTKRCA